MTYEEICALEPRIKDVEAMIRSVYRGPGACAHQPWFGYGPYLGRGAKEQLQRLVGYGAQIDDLKSSEHYDVVYRHLYDLLPNCNHVNACGGDVGDPEFDENGEPWDGGREE